MQKKSTNDSDFSESETSIKTQPSVKQQENEKKEEKIDVENPNKVLTEPSEYAGMSVFLQACYDGNLEKAKELIKKGADRNFRQVSIKNDLIYKNTSSKIGTEDFYNQCQEESKKENSGYNALDLCVMKNRIEVLKYLVDDIHMKLDQECENKCLPIHIATEYNSIECLEYIISKCPEQVNAKQINGMTPLHIAAKNNRYVAASILLQNNCNVDAIDSKGKKPIDYAENKQMENIINKVEVTDSSSTEINFNNRKSVLDSSEEEDEPFDDNQKIEIDETDTDKQDKYEMEASSIAEEEEFPEEEFYEGEFEEEEETQEERFERLKREKELLIQKQEEEERKRAEHEAMINEKLKLYFPHLFKVNTVHQPTKKAQNKSPRVKPKEALHPEVNEKFMKYVNSFVTHSGSMRNFMNNHKNDWFGYCDKNGRNMLHVVAKMGDFYRFALLLNANQAALTLRDSEWKTPLSYVLELSEQETKRKMFNTILEKREILDIGMAREIIEFAESEKSDYYRKILDPYETQKKVYRAPSKKSKFASTK